MTDLCLPSLRSFYRGLLSNIHFRDCLTDAQAQPSPDSQLGERARLWTWLKNAVFLAPVLPVASWEERRTSGRRGWETLVSHMLGEEAEPQDLVTDVTLAGYWLPHTQKGPFQIAFSLLLEQLNGCQSLVDW